MSGTEGNEQLMHTDMLTDLVSEKAGAGLDTLRYHTFRITLDREGAGGRGERRGRERISYHISPHANPVYSCRLWL